MSTLQQGTLLQGGRYKIISTLGQGGFGITYLALQSGLERKVAIKEFFMKDLCNRDEATSHVSVGSTGSVDMVERFKAKFLKEARNMARLNHPNIVRIHDIFEENGTAYYVMEYAEGGSLADKVKRLGYVPEPDAVRYIRQIADALGYIHMQKMNHLDVKPANIMLSEADDAILIDFGLSKQYDATTGNQTSTTPVGISDGYAPMEQYRPGGVGEFSPETDVYSLGATFFKLLTGVTPPCASDVNEDGVPVAELKAKGVSQASIDVISKAMEGRKKDRMKSFQEFIESLGVASPLNVPAPEPNPASVDDEATVLNAQPSDASSNSTSTIEEKDISPSAEEAQTESSKVLESNKQRVSLRICMFLLILLAIVISIIVAVRSGQENYAETVTLPVDEEASPATGTGSKVTISPVQEQNKPVTLPVVEEAPPATGTSSKVTISPVQEQNKPTTSSLYVSSVPSGASVYINGKLIGITPIENKNVSLGTHRVKLSKEGYKDKVFIRTFDGKSIQLTVTLTEKPKRQVPQSSSVTFSDYRKTFAVNGVSFDMMPVTGGTFRMGATKSMDSDADDDESPLHDVTLSDFYIGKTEVTQALWRAVMGTYPSHFSGDNLPVESVSWNDCQEFIRKLNAKTGKYFRLPTEAEWEYAARGGNRSRGHKYSGNDNIGSVAWYDSNSNSKTHPVGTKESNELGIYDMSGNVREWCGDWYGSYSSSSQTNPKGAARGYFRVCRGGSWYNFASYCRSTNRNGDSPAYGYNFIGFRLAHPVK